MDEKFIRDRITYLRMQKNVSEYKMSLDLGTARAIFKVSLPAEPCLPCQNFSISVIIWMSPPKTFLIRN